MIMPQLNRPIAVVTALLAASTLLFGGCATQPPAAKPKATVEDDAARLLVAEVALERGDCRAAAEGYLKATRESDDQRIAARATEVALSCEQLPTARLASARWRELAPFSGEAALAATLVALQLYKLDEASSSLAAWRDSGSAGNQDPGRFAELLERETESTAAYHVFGQVLAKDDPTSDVVLAQATLALHAFDLTAAVSLARRALEMDTSLVQAKLLILRAQALQGDYDDALTAARELQPDLAGDDLFVVADVLNAADRGDQARAELLRLREQPALALTADRRLGALAMEQGDAAEAERRFTALLGQRGGTTLALFYLAELAERRGDIVRALQNYQLLADSSLALLARSAAARIMLSQGDRKGAMALIDEHASQHPEAAIELVTARAQLLGNAGDHNGAIATLDAALLKYPQHPGLTYQRATTLERAGRSRQSIAAFEALLRQRPADPGIANALGFTLADHNRELERAEKLIKQALAVSPDNPAIQDSLGWVYLRKGRVREAAGILEHAWRNGRDAEIAAHWGESLWQLGEQGRARYVWQQALNLDPSNRAVQSTMARLTGEPVPQVGGH
jgi:tetratricopeptide (TPR) repeat protein